MAEIPDRLGIEATILSKLEVDARGVRGALRDGRSVDWGSVQPRMTATLRDEIAAVYIIMFLLFFDDDSIRARLTNAQFPTQDDVAVRAIQFAQRRAEQVMGGVINDAQRRQVEFGGTIPKSQNTGLERSRLEGVVITETTRAGSEGEDAGRVEAQRRTGLAWDLIWYTQLDDRVCPICAPLHKTPMRVWLPIVGVNGPAHPRCRCSRVKELING